MVVEVDLEGLLRVLRVLSGLEVSFVQEVIVLLVPGLLDESCVSQGMGWGLLLGCCFGLQGHWC